MATTKLFAIKTTEVKALAYIANPEKTDDGRLIFTYGCSSDPAQASRDFSAVRAGGTGLNFRDQYESGQGQGTCVEEAY